MVDFGSMLPMALTLFISALATALMSLPSNCSVGAAKLCSGSRFSAIAALRPCAMIAAAMSVSAPNTIRVFVGLPISSALLFCEDAATTRSSGNNLT